MSLAIDMGAESGRVIGGVWQLDENGQGVGMEVHELHRFRHEIQHWPAAMHWNFGGILGEIVQGLSTAARFASQHGHEVVSIGVDTWGVDVGVVDTNGHLLCPPYVYRDPSHDAAYAHFDETHQRSLFEWTGIRPMAINTLFQLISRSKERPGLLDEGGAGGRVLWMPDLIGWWLSGVSVNEKTIASTSQMLGVDGQWSPEALKMAGIPLSAVGELVEPGDVIGSLRDSLCGLTGLPASVQVIAAPGHDTACAVASAPAQGDQWAYVSSGTWSLLGLELDAPVVSEAAFAAGATNEAGVGGKTRFLAPLTGLWLVQECRRQWEREGVVWSYRDLDKEADQASELRTIFDTTDPRFAATGNMVDKIQAYAKETNQPVPETVGQVVRCCFESLALTYGRVLRDLAKAAGKEVNCLHVLGGGSKGVLMNQAVANVLGCQVLAGPIEATAMGNLGVQGMGLGLLDGLPALRKWVRETEELTSYQPTNCQLWSDALAKLESLRG